MSNFSKVDRIDEFESLRGIMALWVLLGHVISTFDLPAFSHLWWWNILDSNLKAVDVFIILSGFVIFHLLNAKHETYRSYIYRRFLRLFPAYLVCLLISIALLRPSLEALQALGTPSPHNAIRIHIFTDSLNHFWPQVVAHLTMLQGLVPNRLLPSSDYAFVGQAWSISVEWQFYLLAPFAFAFARERGWRGWAMLAAMMGFLVISRRFLGAGYVGAHAEYFAVGCACSFLWRAKSGLLERFAKHSNLLIPAITVLLVLVLRDQWQLAIWFCVLASCITTRKCGKEKIIAHAISSLLTIPPLRWLGRISYSFYLIHMAALYSMLWILRGSTLSQTNLMLLTLAGTLVLTLLAAHFSYKWIELPFIEFGRRFPRRKVVPAEYASVSLK
jgi:peptidoglycan/LPS O-acetylase OafA/YrhL